MSNMAAQRYIVCEEKKGSHNTFVRWALPGVLLLTVLPCFISAKSFGAAPDYMAVDAIFNQHCLDCHAAQDPEHGLVLDSFEALIKGGESGAAIVPGKSKESLVVQMIEGRFEKDGKSKIMPPGKRKKLTPD